LALAPKSARAEQFVLFDATFTYTWDDAVNSSPSKSHYYVTDANWLSRSRPTNWMSPVNYRDGTVHIHLEVLEKPAGGQQAGWALCYVGNSGSYGCPYTPYYTETGTYERDVDMHNFFNNATIDWTRGVKEVDLVYTINDSGSGHITNFPDKKDLVTPTRVRVAMIQVAAGSKYDPTQLPGVDGGRPDAGTRDASLDAGSPTIDAAADVVSSGTGGTAGTTGTSGTSGTGGSGPTTGAGGTSGTGDVTTASTTTTGSSVATTGAGGGMTTGPSGRSDDLSGCSCSFASRRSSLGYACLLALFGLARRRRANDRSISRPRNAA
jgi:hypothetical protein